MDKQEELKIIEEMQKVVEHMKINDIEEDPESEFDMFTCSACGEEKPMAGSVTYGESQLCNDCALYAEIGLALGKIESVTEVINSFEDKRLMEMCRFILEDQARHNN